MKLLKELMEWNKPALKFFERAGASLLRERKALCLTGVSLRKIAKKVAAACLDAAEESSG